MKVIVTTNALAGSKKAAEIFADGIKNGAKVLGLATGSTPETLYQEFSKGDFDFSKLTSINLDEYVGLKPDDPQSYHYFMQEHLFKNKPFKNSYVPDGLAAVTNPEQVAADYDQIIKENPIDIQLLGIGQNGHIAFNEPGTSFTSVTHEVKLTENTIKANSRFFDNINDVPTSAICMGTANIMSAKQIVLLAFGKNKAQAIKDTVEGPVSEAVPASILQKHPNAIIIADQEAAALLTSK